MNSVRHVSCPQCGARVEWTQASPFRPFCSQRCKLIDLGAWASESYRIPLAEPAASDEISDPGADAGADPSSKRRGN